MKSSKKPTVIVLDRARRIVERAEGETPPQPPTEAHASRDVRRKVVAKLKRLHPMD